MDEIHWILLSKYLAYECSEDELKFLEHWLIDPENQKVLDQMKLVYQSSMLNDIDADNSLKKLTQRIKDEKLL